MNPYHTEYYVKFCH